MSERSERIINTAERLGRAGAERQRGGGSSERSERIIKTVAVPSASEVRGSSERSERIICTVPSGMAVPSASEVRA